MLRIVIFFLVFFLCFSCNKEADNIIEISGLIVDRINNSPINNVDILLEKKDFGGTTFSNSFDELETTTTNNYGEYEFSFQNSNTVEYRITVSKDGFFSDQTVINPDLLSLEQVNVFDFEIYSSSYLILNLINNSPFNNNDEIILNSDLISSVVGSCFTNVLSLSGTAVDTTIECAVYGNQMVTFDYFVTKDNFTNSYSDSVFCSAGDTLTKYIFY
jgi:hypothetical protein